MVETPQVTRPANSLHRFDPTDPNALASHESIGRANAMLNFDTAQQTQSIEKTIKGAVPKDGETPHQAQAKALLNEFGYKLDDPTKAPRFISDRSIARITHELSKREAHQEVLQFLDERRAYEESIGRDTKFLDSDAMKEVRQDVLRNLGEYQKAIELSNEAIKKNPNNTEAQRVKIMALRDGLETGKLTADQASELFKVTSKDQNIIESLRSAKPGETLSPKLTSLLFEEAFANTGDHSLGMGAVNAALENNDFVRAQELAKITRDAARSVGSEQTKKFWPALHEAQAAVIAEVDPRQQLKAIAHLEELLAGKRPDGTPLVGQTEKDFALKRIDDVSRDRPKVQEALKVIKDRLKMPPDGRTSLGTEYERPMTTPAEKTQALIEKHTYSVREAVLSDGFDVSGSARFGGGLSETSFSPEDMRQFRKIAQRPLEEFIKGGLIESKDLPAGVDPKQRLVDIKNPELLNEVADKLVRRVYNVESLQNLHDVNHTVFDETMTRSLERAGVKATLLTMEESFVYEAIGKDLRWQVSNGKDINGKPLNEQTRKIQNQLLDKKVNKGIEAYLEKEGRLNGLSDGDKQELIGKEKAKFIGHAEDHADLASRSRQVIAEGEIFRVATTHDNVSEHAKAGKGGDCRHVAQAKAALVTSTQQMQERQANQMRVRGVMNGDAALINEGTAEFTRANSYDVRISDSFVKANVESWGTYEPVTVKIDGKEYFVSSSKEQVIETHNQNQVLEKNPDGSLKNAGTRDAFYKQKDNNGKQGPYEMGKQNVGTEVEIVGGKPRLKAGTLEAVDCWRNEKGQLLNGDGDILQKGQQPVPLDKSGAPLLDESVKVKITDVVVTEKVVIMEPTGYSDHAKLQPRAPGPNRFLGHTAKGDSVAERWAKGREMESQRLAEQRFTIEHSEKMSPKERQEAMRLNEEARQKVEDTHNWRRNAAKATDMVGADAKSLLEQGKLTPEEVAKVTQFEAEIKALAKRTGVQAPEVTVSLENESSAAGKNRIIISKNDLALAPEQLKAVAAHEMGHVLEKHAGVKQTAAVELAAEGRGARLLGDPKELIKLRVQEARVVIEKIHAQHPEYQQSLAEERARVKAATGNDMSAKEIMKFRDEKFPELGKQLRQAQVELNQGRNLNGTELAKLAGKDGISIAEAPLGPEGKPIPKGSALPGATDRAGGASTWELLHESRKVQSEGASIKPTNAEKIAMFQESWAGRLGGGLGVAFGGMQLANGIKHGDALDGGIGVTNIAAGSLMIANSIAPFQSAIARGASALTLGKVSTTAGVGKVANGAMMGAAVLAIGYEAMKEQGTGEGDKWAYRGARAAVGASSWGVGMAAGHYASVLPGGAITGTIVGLAAGIGTSIAGGYAIDASKQAKMAEKAKVEGNAGQGTPELQDAIKKLSKSGNGDKIMNADIYADGDTKHLKLSSFANETGQFGQVELKGLREKIEAANTIARLTGNKGYADLSAGLRVMEKGAVIQLEQLGGGSINTRDIANNVVVASGAARQGSVASSSPDRTQRGATTAMAANDPGQSQAQILNGQQAAIAQVQTVPQMGPGASAGRFG